MSAEQNDKNAKDPDWPANLPGVKPEQYDASISSGRGSANASINAMGSGIHPGQQGHRDIGEESINHAKAGHSDTTTFGASTAGLRPTPPGAAMSGAQSVTSQRAAGGTKPVAGHAGTSEKGDSWENVQGEQNPPSAGAMPDK